MTRRTLILLGVAALAATSAACSRTRQPEPTSPTLEWRGGPRSLAEALETGGGLAGWRRLAAESSARRADEAGGGARRSGGGPAPAGLAWYASRAEFEAACPGLPVEDFEEGRVAVGNVAPCPGPLDASSNNSCFRPGEIAPGVRFNATTVRHPFQELVLVGAGLAGNRSKTLAANFFTDGFVVDFTGGDVTAVGMDLVSYPDAGDVDIEIHGAAGLMGATTAPASGAGRFWGVRADEPISRIVITSPTHQSEGVDDIAFGPCRSRVAIDIKPGSDPNVINCGNPNGVIAVAILTVPGFDARAVDHATVRFQGAAETHVDHRSGRPRRHEEDVDGDGDVDLVLHFRYGDTTLTCESTEGTLSGRTYDGHGLLGTDAVLMIVPGFARK